MFRNIDQSIDKNKDKLRASQHTPINSKPFTDTLIEMKKQLKISEHADVRFTRKTHIHRDAVKLETKTGDRNSDQHFTSNQRNNLVSRKDNERREEVSLKSILKPNSVSKSKEAVYEFESTFNSSNNNTPQKLSFKATEGESYTKKVKDKAKSPFIFSISQEIIPPRSLFSSRNLDSSGCQCLPGSCLPNISLASFNQFNVSDVELNMLNHHISNRAQTYIKNLEEFIRVKSISTDPEYLGEMKLMVAMMQDSLKRLNFVLRNLDYKNQYVNPKERDEQRFILASNFSSSQKNTILIYANSDVFPADESTGWLNDPFKLTANDGMLFGRGVSAGKGPLICWLSAIEAWLEELGGELPVNIKIVIDTRSIQLSTGLNDCIKANIDFFEDVDVVIMLVNSWINETLPMLHCSLSGWVHLVLELQNANADLDSGASGGIVYEPMTQLCHLMNSLVTTSGKIRVPKIDREVQIMHNSDFQLLDAADFSLQQYKERLGARTILHEINKITMLRNHWCKPTLTLHGVENDYKSRSYRIIPGMVRGRFSMKLVASQSVDHVVGCVSQHLRAEMKQMESKTNMKLHKIDSSEPLILDTGTPFMLAAARAVSRAHGILPPCTVGIPYYSPNANMLYDIVGNQIILLPYTLFHDWRQSANEAISEQLFIRNIKMIAAIMFEIGNIPAKCKCNLIKDYCMKIDDNNNENDENEEIDMINANWASENRFTKTFSKTSLFKQSQSVLMRNSLPKIFPKTPKENPENTPKKKKKNKLKFPRCRPSKRKPTIDDQSND